ISGTGSLTVAGPMVWAGGSLDLAGAVYAGGGLEFRGGALMSVSAGCQLYNGGEALWTGTGTLLLFGGFTNAGGATFFLPEDVQIGGPFTNSGTLIRAGGEGVAGFVQNFFLNTPTGTVLVETGVLEFRDTFLNYGTVTAGAGLWMLGRPYTQLAG